MIMRVIAMKLLVMKRKLKPLTTTNKEYPFDHVATVHAGLFNAFYWKRTCSLKLTITTDNPPQMNREVENPECDNMGESSRLLQVTRLRF